MKKILKAFIPPIIIYLYNRLPTHSLRIYWLRNKNFFDVNSKLKRMIDFLFNLKVISLCLIIGII